MDPRHKAAIQNQYPSLVAQTDLNVMLSSLYEKGVFAEHMIEQYRNPHTSDTNHKRNLYLHLMRRGPNAFRHLIDTLWENGQWGLARDLDPEGEFHGRPRNTAERSSNNDENSFISLSTKKKEKAKSEAKTKTVTPQPPPPQTPPAVLPHPPPPPPAEPDPSDPPFVVKKCTQQQIIDEANEIKVYPVGRERRQRVMLLYTYMHFEHDIEPPRRGADRDSANLKLLFHELGFTGASYFDHKKEETMASLRELASLLAGATCVFVVVSSHGYERRGSSDNYFRCSDGRLISLYEFIDHFSNQALPKLRGVPKVFIFQTCRGNKDQDYPLAPAHVFPPRVYHDGVSYNSSDVNENSEVSGELDNDVTDKHNEVSGKRDNDVTDKHNNEVSGKRDNDVTDKHNNEVSSKRDNVSHDGQAAAAGSRSGHDGPQLTSRVYSDILIAHSTVPGYVSNRNPEEGSWYIQTLCRVFAEHAHHRHVEELLTLVDQQMESTFHRQTSSVDKWGFNSRLYLMPGQQ